MAKVVKLNSVSNLLEVFKNLESEYEVYCPVKQDDTETFVPVNQTNVNDSQDLKEILSKNEPTSFPLKSFLFPDSETFLEFQREKDKVEFSVTKGKELSRVILGGKPCDVESFKMIDMVFLDEPVDTFYQDNRDKTILISSVCNEKGPNCLCDDFGINRTAPEMADILLITGEKTTANTDEIYLKSTSEKGEKLIEKLTEFDSVEETGEVEINKVESSEEELSAETIKDKIEELYESSIWEELAMRCLSCGICTYYCPTCHCYDISDFYRKDQGVRYRSWDSCMYKNFTNMAGGHNPRSNKPDRIRNRFFHKLNYFVKQQGPLACVGCGRCAKNCPAGISINTVLKKIGGEKFEK
ncbi:4Fe-4S dicluster domain-containing protein [Natranaerobius trueperi]|uniref:4Fe-4S ferredoxin-type domain-containing protein n=1 Tax=Natranaerobius trueperi TaxID=759412 RepID=A0A226BZJ3_9FIRM|nr:4Fe-4S dicluster domain-containing protein [Natranaerobius trueperi]OWZ84341.1 hypothetical protein CDO51_03500 [Natranaerobius trueperi]